MKSLFPCEVALDDGAAKQAWYAAEQSLRNQIDRTYDAQMDFTLGELGEPGPGKGVASPPDARALRTHANLHKRATFASGGCERTAPRMLAPPS